MIFKFIAPMHKHSTFSNGIFDVFSSTVTFTVTLGIAAAYVSCSLPVHELTVSALDYTVSNLKMRLF